MQMHMRIIVAAVLILVGLKGLGLLDWLGRFGF
jgi:hypothetical protein